MSSIHYNLNQWVMYSHYIFSRFNGMINPIFRASRLALGYPISKNTKSVIFGTSVLDEININLLDIGDYCDKNGIIEEEKIRTIIVFTMLHELSHCDQDINFLDSKNDKQKKLKYELENDLNTIDFITNNYEYVTSICGCELDFGTIGKMMHRSGFNTIKDELRYNTITYPFEKVLRVLSGISDEDVEMIILNEDVKDIVVEYTKQNGYTRAVQLMGNKIWCSVRLDLLREISYNTQILSFLGRTKNKKFDGLVLYVKQKGKNLTYPMYIDYRRFKKK